MKPVKNFTQCSQTLSESFIWNEDDTKFGLDVPAWRQIINEAQCSDDSDCQDYCLRNHNGKYLDGKTGKKCFSYEVLENVCMTIQYNNITDTFNYAGGCFENNRYYTLLPASIDNVYSFDSIEMEIRNKEDPIIVAGEMSNYKYDFGQSFVRINILFFIFLKEEKIFIIFYFNNKLY